jgi:hypothetical protein
LINRPETGAAHSSILSFSPLYIPLAATTDIVKIVFEEQSDSMVVSAILERQTPIVRGKQFDPPLLVFITVDGVIC